MLLTSMLHFQDLMIAQQRAFLLTAFYKRLSNVGPDRLEKESHMTQDWKIPQDRMCRLIDIPTENNNNAKHNQQTIAFNTKTSPEYVTPAISGKNSSSSNNNTNTN